MTIAARNVHLSPDVIKAVLLNQPLIYAALIIGMLVELPDLTALRSLLVRARRPSPYRDRPNHDRMTLGCDADLTLFDLAARRTIRNDWIASRRYPVKRPCVSEALQLSREAA